MWKEAAFPLAVMLALAGCSGDGTNPFSKDSDPDSGEETTGITVPAEVAGNVSAMRYDATAQTLTVTGVSLDKVPFQAVYTREAARDADYGGYQVFMAQDDALDRHATALVLQSDGTAVTGRVRAGVAATPGPRNRYLAGGYFERDGDFDPPAVTATSGMVSYAGRYAGLTNAGVRDYGEGILIEPDPSTPDELRPARAAQTTGDVFINADFADNRVEGNIYNRRFVPTNAALPSIVLVASEIDADGTFAGRVEYDLRQSNGAYAGLDDTEIGNYAGIFGGRDASAVGGVVALNQFDGEDALGFETEQEHGVFVIGKCGTAGASASVCNDVK